MSERVFGHFVGYPEGSKFKSRAELAQTGVHRPLISDISGAGREGTDSIVLSGGCEDDEDFGDVIIYTGHGRRDQSTGNQIADQTLTRGNLALACKVQGVPARVVAGRWLRPGGGVVGRGDGWAEVEVVVGEGRRIGSVQ